MDQLIEQLRNIFDCDNEINTEKIKIILENYKSDPLDWSNYVHFDPHKYTRNLIDIGNGKYNLMILCWGPGMGSSVHDHTNSHCFVKVLHGKLFETQYASPNKINENANNVKNNENVPLIKIGSDIYETNSVTYINDEIGLHRMENISHSDPTISLHLYIPPFKECQVYDNRTGRHKTTSVTFYTKYGKKEEK